MQRSNRVRKLRTKGLKMKDPFASSPAGVKIKLSGSCSPGWTEVLFSRLCSQNSDEQLSALEAGGRKEPKLHAMGPWLLGDLQLRWSLVEVCTVPYNQRND